jgi:hypothetical protein
MAKLAEPIVISVRYLDDKKNIRMDVPEQETAGLAKAKADACAGSEGALVGEILTFPVEDGVALYMVTSESPLTIASLEVGDSWTVENSTIEALTVEDVQGRADIQAIAPAACTPHVPVAFPASLSVRLPADLTAD